jgi:integrase/recombinase XerD
MTESNMFQRGETWFLRAEIAGRKYRESLHTANVREARRLRDARIKVIEAQARHGAVSWHEAVVEWFRHVEGQVAKATLQRYLQSLKLCEPYLVGKMVGAIDGAVIRALIAARRQEVTIATVRRDLTAISQVLSYAQSVGWREGNPALDASRTLRERRDPMTLPDEGSIQAVFAECSPHLRNLAIAARLTGCRQAELVGAKWAAFDDGAGTLEVIGKGNKRRTIKLSEGARQHIAGLDRSDEVIFSSADGPWTSVSPAFAKTVHRAKAAADEEREEDESKPRLIPFRFHDLRHIYAIETLRGGTSIYKVSQHLGHTSVKTTEQFYLAHLTADEADRARD